MWPDLTTLLITWLFYFSSVVVVRKLIRKPYQLQLIVVLHNLLLALASLWMFVGITKALKDTWSKDGWKAIYCPYSTMTEASLFSFSSPSIISWLYIFHLSKFYELLDTFILICRGKQLTFLHVWHHASVLLETWAWVRFGLTFASLGMLFNTFIHIWMYAYFAVSAMHIQVPWRRWITTMQIIQFVCSFLLSIPYLYWQWRTTHSCGGIPAWIISIVCNGSYLLLFMQFYTKTYTRRSLSS
ncbi:Putative elongation of fatty acids protein [Galdieria sulphuraria]|nr:Putative elongation of fatty acids protein [Galdieria sulphuraria]